MRKFIQQSSKKTKGKTLKGQLYIAFLNEKMIGDSAASLYSLDKNTQEKEFDENWMPAIFTPEEEEMLYDKYY